MPAFTSHLNRIAGHLRRQRLIVAIILSSLFCLGLLAFRLTASHNQTYSFMGRNLMLAWLPLICAWVTSHFPKDRRGLWQVIPLVSAILWLVFLPNAPYLVTDLAHLATRGDMFLWIDMTMFAAFAMAGLLYGTISIYWMQRRVGQIFGMWSSWLFVIGVLALTSFGIYLGRFLRWNSWDVLQNPAGLLTDIWEMLRHPIAHYQTFAFSGLFTLFLISAYLLINALTDLSEQR